ncbi:MAG: proton-conducting transporter transmembrane domain-containing protein [Chitinophagaceae bacterium]
MITLDWMMGSFVLVLLGGALIPFLAPGHQSKAGLWLVLLNVVFTSVPAIQGLLSHSTLVFWIKMGGFMGPIPLRIDPLAAWFILIINLACLNAALYRMGYLKSGQAPTTKLAQQWISFVVFQVSMLWVCMLQNGLAFLLAWEIMSLSSLMLIIFEQGKSFSLKSGGNYLVKMHIGSALLLLGFLWIHHQEGSFDFMAIGKYLEQPASLGVAGLFFIGFGIRAGFIPLHSWIPKAHSEAPAHNSGVMSGVLVKLGIYGLLRMITYLHTGFLPIGEGLLALSLLTAFYGIMNCLVQKDFKKMLSFSTVENIGIIGIGMGIGLIGLGTGNMFVAMAGFGAALMHTLNHSLYKFLLFFSAGNLYLQTHSRNMDHLGGLIKKMPVTAFFFLMGSMAIAGLPPLNGFVSEFLIYSGMMGAVQSGPSPFNLVFMFSILLFSLIGGITIFAFSRAFGMIFLGHPRTPLPQQPQEVSRPMRWPLWLILAVMLVIGIFPQLLFPILGPVIQVLVPSLQGTSPLQAFVPIFKTTGLVSLVFLLITFLIYALKSGLRAGKSPGNLPAWGCGYLAPNSRMQYTGYAMAKSLRKFFPFFSIEKRKYRRIEEMEFFPSPRTFQSAEVELLDISHLSGEPGFSKKSGGIFAFFREGKKARYTFIAGVLILLILVALLLKWFI